MAAADPLGGRYRLVERLGSGGMSVVWRGYDEVLQRWVAVKLLSAELADRSRLSSTATDGSPGRRRLSHPHIAGVYDYGTCDEDDPRPFVVMELVSGPALGQRLAHGRTLHWRAAAVACAQVAAGLAFAHDKGVVHRDVTPANVLVGPTGAKLVDFGISALVGELDPTPDGHILGTPAYLAPERLDGGPAETAPTSTPWADLLPGAGRRAALARADATPDRSGPTSTCRRPRCRTRPTCRRSCVGCAAGACPARGRPSIPRWPTNWPRWSPRRPACGCPCSTPLSCGGSAGAYRAPAHHRGPDRRRAAAPLRRPPVAAGDGPARPGSLILGPDPAGCFGLTPLGSGVVPSDERQPGGEG